MRSTKPPSAPPLPPPDATIDHFKLVDRLAVGGMSEVFRALDSQSVGEPRMVIIKKLLPALALNEGGRAMFQAESDLVSNIDHPNVVRMLGKGEHEHRPYLALEYVRGVDLRQLINWMSKSGERMPAEVAIFVGRQLLAGLQYVHDAVDKTGQALHIVHQDISPSNILLSIHGEVKLGDFGIAKARLRQEFPRTPNSAHVRGKLGYLSPEQVTGSPAEKTSDIFSAAVIISELLIGRPLFAGDSELNILIAIRDAHLGPLLDCHELPHTLIETLANALCPFPSRRTASAAEFSRQLQAFQTRQNEAALQELLAHLVQRCLRARSHSGNYHPPATPASSGRPTMDATPISFVPEAEQVCLDQPPVTREMPVVTYRIRTQAGQNLGPIPYAEIVEKITTGNLGPEDLINLHGETFRPIAEVVHLSRHLPPSSANQMTTGRRVTLTPPDDKQQLSHGGIVSMLARCILSKETGLLLCEIGTVRKEVYFRDGVPEYVGSNLAGELLGEYLVSHQIISREELDMALAVLPRFDGKLGDTLTALGLLDPIQLFQAIADQVRHKLLDLFTWENGSGTFYRGVDPPASGFPLGLDPWDVLLEGVKLRLDQGLERLDMQSDAEIFSSSARIPEWISVTQLPHSAQTLLQTLRQPKSGSEISHLMSSEPRTKARLASMLALFRALGLVTTHQG